MINICTDNTKEKDNKIILRYVSDSGDVIPDQRINVIEGTINILVKLIDTIPTKIGYKFIGWKREGDEMIYKPSDTVVIHVRGIKIVTFYGVWEEVYTPLPFDDVDNQKQELHLEGKRIGIIYCVGDDFILNTVITDKPYYDFIITDMFTAIRYNEAFIGWALQEDGDVVFRSGDNIRLSSTLILYPVFRKKAKNDLILYRVFDNIF